MTDKKKVLDDFYFQLFNLINDISEKWITLTFLKRESKSIYIFAINGRQITKT